MTLDQSDRLNPLWVKFMEHFEKRLVNLRGQLEGDLDERKTAEMRGRIAEIKALIALGKEDQAVPPPR